MPALLAKSLWTPHSVLPKELMSVFSNFVHELPDLHCEEPIDGEQYLLANQILDCLQDYAFTKGFAVFFNNPLLVFGAI